MQCDLFSKRNVCADVIRSWKWKFNYEFIKCKFDAMEGICENEWVGGWMRVRPREVILYGASSKKPKKKSSFQPARGDCEPFCLSNLIATGSGGPQRWGNSKQHKQTCEPKQHDCSCSRGERFAITKYVNRCKPQKYAIFFISFFHFFFFISHFTFVSQFRALLSNGKTTAHEKFLQSLSTSVSSVRNVYRMKQALTREGLAEAMENVENERKRRRRRRGKKNEKRSLFAFYKTMQLYPLRYVCTRRGKKHSSIL